MDKKTLIKQIIRIVIHLSIVIVGTLGIIFTKQYSESFMGGSAVFLYFTVQSNIFMMLMAFLCFGHEVISLVRKETTTNQVMLIIKYCATISVTITFIVFFTMLAPLLGIDYLLSFNNFSLHAIVPILSIVDYIVFDTDINLNYKKSLFGLIAPLSYVVFVYAICYPNKLQFGENMNFPYFFLDFEKNGFFFEKGFGVIPWILVLLVAISGLCFLYCFLIKLREKHSK